VGRNRKSADKESYKNKKVTVMGLGLFGGGVGVTRFLVSQGAYVTVTDLRSAEELSRSIRLLEDLPVNLRLGKHIDEDFSSVDLVIGNPAVPESSRFLQIARDNDIPIDTELNIFFRLCPASITGITGSNGKSTTTALLGEMLKRSGRKTWIGGNIGISLLEHVDKIGQDDAVVLELSSFQLEALGKIMLSPDISVVTNIVPNHLDRHKTLREYIDAKKAIIRFQDEDSYTILNYDDQTVRKWKDECKGNVLWYSVAKELEEGAFLSKNEIVLHFDSKKSVITDKSEIKLKGLHNVQNVLAAVCAAGVTGVPVETIGNAVIHFSGLEHRLEFVRSIHGILYYNDSKATTPEAAIAGIKAFYRSRKSDKAGEDLYANSQPYRHGRAQGAKTAGVIIIAGGYDKGVSFNKFAHECIKGTKCVILTGDTAKKIKRCIQDIKGVNGKPEVYVELSLEEAVIKASTIAREGDVVLLSPACASYCMFTNYEERGARFKELVSRMDM